jgi:hypothetical protein
MNGLRHPASFDTNGWYIRFGADFPTAGRFRRAASRFSCLRTVGES